MISPLLLAFVRSRIPMVEHDFTSFEGESRAHAVQRDALGRYAIAQAFFYAADLWVKKPPLVSVRALEYANQRWGDQAQKIWTLKRAEIPRLDGCKIGQSGLIYEHVTTGGMFRKFLETRMLDRAGILDPFEVALWLQDNYQTAWVTREEDEALSRRKFKSQRGLTLEDARAAYKQCEIEISELRPIDLPSAVLVGDTSLDDEIEVDTARVDESYAQPSRPTPNSLGLHYSQFFQTLSQALQVRNTPLTINTRGDRPYASLRGFDNAGTREVVVILDGLKGSQIRTPVLSLEAVTKRAGEEPTTEGWSELRDIFFGPDWRISYGKDGGLADALCRCKRSLALDFDISDASARDNAAQRTAEELGADWMRLRG